MKDEKNYNIWMLSREYGDLAGAGGVKDVVRQLAECLARDFGMSVNVVMPKYGFMDPVVEKFQLVHDPTETGKSLSFPIDMNYAHEERQEVCRAWYKTDSGVTVYLIESGRFEEKEGVYTYTEGENKKESWKQVGSGHYDYFAMNVLLQKSALELAILLGEIPDVIHCHDGHTALIPALIRECQGWRSYFRNSGCLVTIHNAGVGYHQEVDDLVFAGAVTGLPQSCIAAGLLNGKFDPFLVAGQYAVLNTVSENYARELQETDEDWRTDWLGHALLERGIRLEGITNGISPESFDPSNAALNRLPAQFDPADENDNLEGKKQCKEQLLQKLGAGDIPPGVELYGTPSNLPDLPIFAFIGRLSEQKGVDLLLQAIQLLSETHKDWQLILLGNGMELIEAEVIGLTESKAYSGRISFLRGFSTELAETLYAASDFFVIPSRFEPCGLTDFIAQLYGSVPVVHHIGGLVKVIHGVTGLAYQDNTVEALVAALKQALELYENNAGLRQIRKQAVDNIRDNHTWLIKGEKYRELYLQTKTIRRKGVN